MLIVVPAPTFAKICLAPKLNNALYEAEVHELGKSDQMFSVSHPFSSIANHLYNILSHLSQITLSKPQHVLPIVYTISNMHFCLPISL